MSGYRPARTSGLGAHVTGAPAYGLATVLQQAKAEAQLSGLTPDVRAATMATLDDIRCAAKIWDLERRGGEAVASTVVPVSGDTHTPAVPVLTVSQAALALGVTGRRVRQLADAGVLLGQKVGRQWQLEAGSVESRKLAADLN